MTSDFEWATEVRRVGEGRYESRIADDWDIAGNANGGYLMALAARAMGDAVGRPPLTLTAHFVSPGLVGPVTVDVEVVRSGRRMAVVRGTLRTEQGQPVLALVGTFADPAPEHELAGAPTLAPVELPPPDECIRSGPPVPMGGFAQQVVTRYHPDDVGFREGRPTGRAEMRGWFELADGGPIDAFALLLAADAFAPVCFDVPGVPVSWAPTLEMTTHIRAVPAPGPVRVRFASSNVRDGMFEESGDLWDADGRLVAQSRQLALVPRS